MRTALNVSLPPQIVKEIKKVTKQENYSSVSEFIKDVMQSFLEDQRLIESLKRSEEDVKAGRIYPLRSVKDLY